MGQVTGERSRISFGDYLGVLAYPELKLTVKDEQQSAGPGRVRLTALLNDGRSS